MVLLIQLSGVIALRVTRAQSSAITAINGVCERRRGVLCVTLPRTVTQIACAEFLVSTLDVELSKLATLWLPLVKSDLPIQIVTHMAFNWLL